MSDPSAKPRKKNRDRLIGEVLAGRYEIEGRLGKGGMAVVYKALDRSFGRAVAIKVLRTDVAKDPIAAKRLIREARAAGQLHHPNIITMHDVGTADGMVYIVMEVLVGCELSDLMEELGPIDVLRSLDIARQVASGLAVAHRAGIVHRDIKPENLFLIDTESGADYIKMLDFSIAKLPSAMVTAALTRAGSVFGTPHYMAPEQVEGRTVCNQTDLYALGAVLYECIAGEPPFDGDSVIDILLQHARNPPPKLDALGIWLPEGLSQLVDSLLAKKESDRPESATVVEHVLERMIEETKRCRVVVPPTEIRTLVTEGDVAAFQSEKQGAPTSAPPPTAPPPQTPVAPPVAPPTAAPPTSAPSSSAPPAADLLATPLSIPATSPDAAELLATPLSLPLALPDAAAASPLAPTDLPSRFAGPPPSDLPGGVPMASSTLLGAGLADKVNQALAEREASRAAAGAAIADIAPPPSIPALIPASTVSAPSSVVFEDVPPPPESRARMQSKLRRDAPSAPRDDAKVGGRSSSTSNAKAERPHEVVRAVTPAKSPAVATDQTPKVQASPEASRPADSPPIAATRRTSGKAADAARIHAPPAESAASLNKTALIASVVVLLLAAAGVIGYVLI